MVCFSWIVLELSFELKLCVGETTSVFPWKQRNDEDVENVSVQLSSPPQLGELSPLLPQETCISSSTYCNTLRVPVFCVCCVHFVPFPPSIPSACTRFPWTFTGDVNLAALSENHGPASVAWPVTPLLLVLYLVWGFRFPGPAGGLEYARMSLHCSLNPEWVSTQKLCQLWFLTAQQGLHSFLFRWMFFLLGNFFLMQDYLSVVYNINTNTYKYQCSIWCGTLMDL